MVRKSGDICIFSNKMKHIFRSDTIIFNMPLRDYMHGTDVLTIWGWTNGLQEKNENQHLYNFLQFTNDVTHFVFGLLRNNAVMYAGKYLSMFSNVEIEV